jgi:hypothetical protein
MASKFDRVPRDRLVPNPKAKPREQFHEVARYRQLSLRTEEAYSTHSKKPNQKNHESKMSLFQDRFIRPLRIRARCPKDERMSG